MGEREKRRTMGKHKKQKNGAEQQKEGMKKERERGSDLT